MRNYFLNFLLAIFPALSAFSAQEPAATELFGAEDLHLRGKVMKSFQASAGEQILAFTNGFGLSIGDNLLKSDQAIIWLSTSTTEYQGAITVDRRAKVYLQDGVSVQRGAGSMTSGVEITDTTAKGIQSMVADFTVTGEVFASAENKIAEDIRKTELYKNALLATGQIKPEPKPTVEISLEDESIQNAQPQTAKTEKAVNGSKEKKPAAKTAMKKDEKQNILSGLFGKNNKQQPKKIAKSDAPKKPAVKEASPKPVAPAPKIQYPVNISGLGSEPVKITNENLPDGTSIATIINRFYLWQKQNEEGVLLEIQADNAVIFYAKGSKGDANSVDGLVSSNTVKAIYLRGNIIMTEGPRTIKADEGYYDFQTKQALVVNAVMRNYDPDRGIPIYVKAARLRQVAENKFAAENVTLTNSEFYVPQTSMTASNVIITDTTAIDEQTGKLGPQSYDADMRNVKLKQNNKTVFWWPRIRSNIRRADMPLKRASLSNDNDFGMGLETEWYLARILGLREPAGVDSTLLFDYYSKRGMGVGTYIEYERDDYFGDIDAYIINDRGKDDLGETRENIVPPRKLRGKFQFQHRQFLPDNWQLTLETAYLSDENFYESFNRSDFFTVKDLETDVHLKRIKDNWGFSLLAKWRINNFADELEELPSVQYHRTGQSLFNDKFTLYSDSYLGRLRQRIGDNHTLNVSQEHFTFGTTRNELDFPLKFARGNIVPYIAGIYGYDDRYGFDRNSAIGAGTQPGEKNAFIGQFGTRASTQYWRTYNNIRSRFWDIDGIRHIVKPYVNAAVFAENSDAVEQRDVFSFGVLQRLQTKRGAGEKKRTVEWMRLNLEYTMVSDDSSVKRPDRTIWNNPFVPLSALVAPDILNGDLTSYRSFELFGPQRDNLNADYIWRISDTTAILSDLNYDTVSNEVEQFNIGLSRLCWPNLSYYIGARYLRSLEIDDEKGSNAFTFAVTYKLTPRYTITYSLQYDFDFGKHIFNQFSIIRRYHRFFYALTYSADETLDREAIVLSIWPQGVSELSMGSRRYMGLNVPQDSY